MFEVGRIDVIKVDVGDRSFAPSGPIRPKNYQPTLLFGGLAVFLSAMQSVACFVIIAGYWRLDGYAAELKRFQESQVYSLERFQREMELHESVPPAEDQLRTVEGGAALIACGEGILFVIWMFMAHRNLKQLGRRGLDFEPSSTLIWWIVPVMSFWMPCRVACEIWNASYPDVGVSDGIGWQKRRSSYVVIVWWLLFWGTAVASMIGGRDRPAGSLNAAAFHGFVVILTVTHVLTIVTNMWQATWTFGVIRRQSLLYQKLAEAAEATPSASPEVAFPAGASPLSPPAASREAVETPFTKIDVGASRSLGFHRGAVKPRNYRSTAPFAALIILVSIAQSAAWIVILSGYRTIDEYSTEAKPLEADSLRLSSRSFARHAEIRDLQSQAKDRVEWIAYYATWVAFGEAGLLMLWMFTAHRNLEQLGRRGIEFEPMSTLIWWFVPLVNAWLPCRVACETWNASNPDPDADGLGWRNSRSPRVVVVWWLLLWAAWGAWLYADWVRIDPGSWYQVSHEYVVRLTIAYGLAIATNLWQVVWLVALVRKQRLLHRRLTAATDAQA